MITILVTYLCRILVLMFKTKYETKLIEILVFTS